MLGILPLILLEMKDHPRLFIRREAHQITIREQELRRQDVSTIEAGRDNRQGK